MQEVTSGISLYLPRKAGYRCALLECVKGLASLPGYSSASFSSYGSSSSGRPVVEAEGHGEPQRQWDGSPLLTVSGLKLHSIRARA